MKSHSKINKKEKGKNKQKQEQKSRRLACDSAILLKDYMSCCDMDKETTTQKPIKALNLKLTFERCKEEKRRMRQDNDNI